MERPEGVLKWDICILQLGGDPNISRPQGYAVKKIVRDHFAGAGKMVAGGVR